MSREKYKEIICNRIKTLRIKKNLKLEQLAYRSGISKGGLSEIERGKKLPDSYTICRICCGLNITLKEFFDFEEIELFKSTI